MQVTEEARDNLKFLTTLERHFKNITSGPLPAIVDTLPPTMNALRMVWIISRYYSDDMRMGALFKRIGQEIGDRVEAAIDVKVGWVHVATQAPCSSLLLCSSCVISASPNWFGHNSQATYLLLHIVAPLHLQRDV